MPGKHLRGEILSEDELPYDSVVCGQCECWLNFIGYVPKEFTCPYCKSELEISDENIEGEFIYG